ncbi:MAG TPA: carbamoyltransferase C-terminal domain-containing protein [Polyangiales bacterium]|nr:carbamoyltransferase C-terminal domain-containing protein [Polyangiales bacterium]
MSLILGLNAYHADSAACLLMNGRLIAAAEEERFRRIKHWAGFPSEAIAYCLREAGVKLADVDHIALNSDPRANLLRKALFALQKRSEVALVMDRLRNARRRSSVEEELARAFPNESWRGRVHRVEHHFAHLASCFLVSPFHEAAVVSVDGFGDFSSAAWGVGRGQRIEVDGRVYFPHSLGIFYQALTQYLGFPNYGDEYKVMGLAPYGQPRYLDAMRQIVRTHVDGTFELDLKFFRHHRENVPYRWSDGVPEVGALYTPQLSALLGPERTRDQPLEERHRDIARSIQALYEEAFFNLLRRLHETYRLPNVVIAGGCGMNSVANGKIALHTPFRDVYVQAAAGDAGGAIGAAFAVANDTGVVPARGQMPHAYWGPSFSTQQIADVLRKRESDLASGGCRVERIEDEDLLCTRVAQHIANGDVVGWFHGRMEWGPRALGNRSIVCDPRRSDMKDLLNRKIKRRESFRPFAPSVLRESVRDWFEQEQDVPFMMQVFQIREEKRTQIPAVTHVDGSGRLQTVSAESNPRYHKLISRFRDLTSVPMILNTSFNENEPVVCRPEEALDCFLRTRMDVLALENYVITREPSAGQTD